MILYNMTDGDNIINLRYGNVISLAVKNALGMSKEIYWRYKLSEGRKKMWIDLPPAFSPSSSSPTCTFQIRDTSPNRSSDSRSTWRGRNICARPRWCCTSTGGHRRASSRICQRPARSRRRSPDPSPRSRWTCRRRRRTCTRSDTCPSLCYNGTTVPPDSPALPAFLRNSPDAPTGPTWQLACACRRCCRKRRLCCSIRPEEVYARKVKSRVTRANFFRRKHVVSNIYLYSFPVILFRNIPRNWILIHPAAEFLFFSFLFFFPP